MVVAFSCAQLADSTGIVDPVPTPVSDSTLTDPGPPPPTILSVDTADVVIVYYGGKYGQQTLLAYMLGYAVTTNYVNNTPIATNTGSSTSLYAPNGRVVNQGIVYSVKVLPRK